MSFGSTMIAQSTTDPIIEECELMYEIFDELEYFRTEMEAIKKRKSKGYYSKEEVPYEMLDYSFRKFVKKKISIVEFKYFTQTMKSVDNYLAAIENKFNKQISNDKMGFDNKAEGQRFQDAKLNAEKAYVEEKARLEVDCSAPTKESKKKKKK